MGASGASEKGKFIAISLPGGQGGIGFDDLGFSASLHRVLVPAGQSGTLDLIDPDTRKVSSIRGFANGTMFDGGHGEGITSVDEGKEFLLVTDRTARQLDVVDPKEQCLHAAGFGAGLCAVCRRDERNLGNRA